MRDPAMYRIRKVLILVNSLMCCYCVANEHQHAVPGHVPHPQGANISQLTNLYRILD
jgi:hypothetical protein